MKIHKLIYASSALAIILFATACSDELESNMGPDGRLPIAISGEIDQLMTTRAGDTGFVDGDVMGIYVVDYDGTQPGTLLSSGNHADNVRHTYNYPGRRWDAAHGIYWNDKHTPVDIYGYYPAGIPGDVNAYTFTVQADQLKTYDDGTMGGYEASDFLCGKVGGVAPTSSRIKLSLSHRMATARVTLVEGDGFGEGEWGKTRKQVLVTNTVRDAVIDLSTGEVTPSGEKDPNSIIPFVKYNEWRAIVVPQTMAAGTQLFSISIDGIPYKYTASEEFAYVAGKMSNFAIKVDKKGATAAARSMCRPGAEPPTETIPNGVCLKILWNTDGMPQRNIIYEYRESK